MSIRLLFWLQIDIAELDSIQLRKDRKGWCCVRIAFFCFDRELQIGKAPRETDPRDLNIFRPELALRNVTSSVSQKIIDRKSRRFGSGCKSHFQVGRNWP